MVDFPYEIELNGMWAISEFTAASGATQEGRQWPGLLARQRGSPQRSAP